MGTGPTGILINAPTVINAIKRAATKELEYHIAFKKANYIDENGNLDIISDLWDDTREETNPLYELVPVQTSNDGTFTDHEATIKLGATVNEANTYWFEVNLTDANTHAALEGATYDRNIVSGDITRKITGRKTDSSGNIKTKISVHVTPATVLHGKIFITELSFHDEDSVVK